MEEKYKDEEWLREQYVEKGRTQKDIASDFDCTHSNISYYCEKFGIKTRDTGRDDYPPKPPLSSAVRI